MSASIPLLTNDVVISSYLLLKGGYSSNAAHRQMRKCKEEQIEFVILVSYTHPSAYVYIFSARSQIYER